MNRRFGEGISEGGLGMSLLDKLKEEFPEFDVDEIIIDMCTISGDSLHSFVIVAEIGGKFYIIKRANGGYDLSVVDSFDNIIDVVIGYFIVSR